MIPCVKPDTSDESYNIALDCVDKHAASERTALYFVQEGKVQSFTFKELKRLTDSAAHFFAAKKFERGERVVIALPNSTEFIIAFIGAMKAGLVPVPVFSLLTASELEFIVQDSGAVLVVDAPPHPNPLPKGEREFLVQPTSPNDPAYWLYTSGTEGTPKGVIHAHRSIPAHNERVKLWQDWREGDVVFNTSSLNWSYALTCGWLDIWRQGGTVVIYSGAMMAEVIWKVVRDLKVTILMSVPAVYRRLAGALPPLAPPYKGGELRVCLSAGEKLDEEIRQKFLEKTGITIREGLGMTEHSVYLVQRVGEDPVQGSCGKPLPGTRIAILREDMTECEPDEVGVIASHRSCPGLMLGDFNPWFISNDLATKDEDGNIFFLGRRDDVITAGGYRISPMEVEAALNRHPAVVESAAVGKELEPGKTIVCAHVVKKNKVSSEELQAFAKQLLAPYKIPRQIIFVQELPKTSNGKIKRGSLKMDSRLLPRE